VSITDAYRRFSIILGARAQSAPKSTPMVDRVDRHTENERKIERKKERKKERSRVMVVESAGGETKRGGERKRDVSKYQ